MTAPLPGGDFTSFHVTVTRAELALGPLDINDHLNFIVADKIMGGQATWNRQTAKSPFVDGEFTVHRSRAQLKDQMSVQVLGDTQTTMQANLATVIAAFTQFRFQMTLALEDGTRIYNCETADYTVDWDRLRWMSRQVLVTFDIPRYPGLATP